MQAGSKIQEIEKKKKNNNNRNHTKFVLRLNRFKLEITNKPKCQQSLNNSQVRGNLKYQKQKRELVPQPLKNSKEIL